MFCGCKRCAVQSADSRRGSGAGRGGRERTKHSGAEQAMKAWGAERGTGAREGEGAVGVRCYARNAQRIAAPFDKTQLFFFIPCGYRLTANAALPYYYGYRYCDYLNSRFFR
ncbi:MAG: hypothetical protein FWD58_07545 [Firmicutes bacterium]|nr:hypothetical protein [Bacillota bacterium]